jgi:hypothetical protein
MFKSSFRPKARSWQGLLSLAVLGALGAYSGDASATWQECIPVSIFEIAPRSFQVNCSNGTTSGISTWLVYRAGAATSAENEAAAARFQSLVIAAILSGNKFRADASAEATPLLCAGITDCRIVARWGMVPG